ncbi:hypothetical protein ABK040_015815 [Willaertia magna]
MQDIDHHQSQELHNCIDRSSDWVEIVPSPPSTLTITSTKPLKNQKHQQKTYYQLEVNNNIEMFHRSGYESETSSTSTDIEMLTPTTTQFTENNNNRKLYPSINRDSNNHTQHQQQRGRHRSPIHHQRRATHDEILNINPNYLTTSSNSEVNLSNSLPNNNYIQAINHPLENNEDIYEEEEPIIVNMKGNKTNERQLGLVKDEELLTPITPSESDVITPNGYEEDEDIDSYFSSGDVEFETISQDDFCYVNNNKIQNGQYKTKKEIILENQVNHCDQIEVLPTMTSNNTTITVPKIRKHSNSFAVIQNNEQQQVNYLSHSHSQSSLNNNNTTMGIGVIQPISLLSQSIQSEMNNNSPTTNNMYPSASGVAKQMFSKNNSSNNGKLSPSFKGTLPSSNNTDIILLSHPKHNSPSPPNALSLGKTKQPTIKPSIKHLSIGKGRSVLEGIEDWILPGEVVGLRVGKVGILKNLPVGASDIKTIVNHYNNGTVNNNTNGGNNNAKNQNVMTTTEELFNELPFYDLLLGAVTNGGNTNSGTANNTNNNGSSFDTYETEPTLLMGELYITNYQIRFQTTPSNYFRTPLVLSSPLSCINRMEPKYPETENSYSNYYHYGNNIINSSGNSNTDKFNSVGYLSVKCKDLQVLKVLFFKDSSSSLDKVVECLRAVCACTVKKLFAFNYRKMCQQINEFTQDELDKGWKVYRMKREFKRQGLGDILKRNSVLGTNQGSPWRVSCINHQYKVCDTYPEQLIVPREISDEMLIAAAAFRSKGRIPVLTWVHPSNKCCISRSSQPMVGITRARCREDEELIEGIRRASNCEKLQIFDCRPRANAWANTVMGKGYENVAYYTNCAIEFMNIDNIHTMTNSLHLLQKLIQKPSNDTYWLSSLENSGWLKHTKVILQAALKVVHSIERLRTSVLVHCSDGWDRTAQICALSQLLLDPYYRTIEGFEVLIEKDWVSFGFKFLDRVGHLVPKSKNASSDEVSPVFLQFIDCVWHIFQQFPTSFEFNEAFLIAILDNLYSSKYGNFLHNCQKQREEDHVTKDTVSLWSYINHNKELFINEFYVPPSDRNISATLIVNTDMETLVAHFWISYFFRYKRGTKGRYQRLLKRSLSKTRKENNNLKQLFQHEVSVRKKIEKDLFYLREKLKSLTFGSTPITPNELKNVLQADLEGRSNAYLVEEKVDSSVILTKMTKEESEQEESSNAVRFQGVTEKIVENYFN